jgi:potassium-transporting ATPase potassium-binding subunit
VRLADFYSAIQYVLFVAIVTILVKPLGGYMERVFSRQRTALDRLCLPVERFIYRITAVDPGVEMTGKEYATCFVLFGLTGTLLLYAILRMQQFLPWFFPQYHTTPLSPDLALNTAISFSTTTTWQAYAGENTMSYFSQMVGLCAQNFLAGAAGLAVGVAFIRGLARQLSDTLGNFWVDLTRALLWILLPGALLGAVLLVWQGVPMNFHHYAVATTVEGAQQVIPQGPVAALEIIKNLGTNGGGFFNANGAHPYENPTPLTNFLEMLAIVLLPAAFTNTFGRMVGQPRQGWLLYYVMLLLFGCGLFFVHYFERRGDPRLGDVDFRSSRVQSGGNMEGKEVRFGIGASTLTAVVTSNTATGSNNSMHDSYTSIGGMVLLVNMLLGELVFGGLGTGLYSMVMAAAIAVFLAGLMVGRTPEYLGKKIGPCGEQNDHALCFGRSAGRPATHRDCREHPGGTVRYGSEIGGEALQRCLARAQLSQFLFAELFGAACHVRIPCSTSIRRNSGSGVEAAMSPRARSNRKLTATSVFEYMRICSKAASSRRSKWIHPMLARTMPGGS